ncbi:hypothetical protein [Segniliparus rugosus]|uniref:Transposase n=1 Tax=Segniliparus rugosus (strain ATCC BAA-974 / DSM 45345 / CCUG 50838 / CIP 108380 / JCM 13579 / CDC 945) TaxID=679197 RepID=E5XU89_SEGRC|nr:hypothetical protein [Segniliparus rugosus]EFV12088.1 hypothetical protein HMPREF9336_03061 [Segniliparus rugosus ATCC BAA-974]
MNRLRDHFPKRTDLGGIAPGELRPVTDEINARPRKSLGWAEHSDLMATEKELATASVSSARQNPALATSTGI